MIWDYISINRSLGFYLNMRLIITWSFMYLFIFFNFLFFPKINMYQSNRVNHMNDNMEEDKEEAYEEDDSTQF